MENTTLKINGFKFAQNKNLPKTILCFSHLRWDFVFQRPQHVLSRLSQNFNIYFFEEPQFDTSSKAYLRLLSVQQNVTVIVPHLACNLKQQEQIELQKDLLDRLLNTQNLSDFIFWYYTPMALQFSEHLHPKLIVYDCMDELSAFKFAPKNISLLERQLFKIADLVFTGGESLYQAKKHLHSNMYAFPSSIDKLHFNRARKPNKLKLRNNLNLKLGYSGVIDERFDLELIRAMALKKPNWLFEIIGPVVKIDPNELPKLPNIHYIGPVDYQQLPEFLITWDIALIPFLLNEATRFISPTKTPEYLAAGLPVISTPIRDVVHPYGINKLVKIGRYADEFIDLTEEWIRLTPKQKKNWLSQVDEFLNQQSWEKTCSGMLLKIEETLEQKLAISVA